MAKDKTGPRYVDGVKIKRCPACISAGRDGKNVGVGLGNFVRCGDSECLYTGPVGPNDLPRAVSAHNALSDAVKRGMNARPGLPHPRYIDHLIYNVKDGVGDWFDHKTDILIACGYTNAELAEIGMLGSFLDAARARTAA